jgi:hypothetical protein
MKNIKILLTIIMATTIIGSSALTANAETITSEQNMESYGITSEIVGEKDSITGLTDKEVYQLYQQYLSEKPYSINIVNEETNQAQLDHFVQYAVQKGIIQNTPQAKEALSKAFLRSQFVIAAGIGKTAGFNTAAILLAHSLQDNPSNLTYQKGSDVSNQIQNSSEFKKIISNLKNYVRGKKLGRYFGEGSTTLNSTTDLHLAFNKISYVFDANKSNGKWTVDIRFKDKYDFDKIAWKAAGNKVVTIINNYAVAAQSVGAIVPYDVTINTQGTFYE